MTTTSSGLWPWGIEECMLLTPLPVHLKSRNVTFKSMLALGFLGREEERVSFIEVYFSHLS